MQAPPCSLRNPSLLRESKTSDCCWTAQASQCIFSIFGFLWFRCTSIDFHKLSGFSLAIHSFSFAILLSVRPMRPCICPICPFVHPSDLGPGSRAHNMDMQAPPCSLRNPSLLRESKTSDFCWTSQESQCIPQFLISFDLFCRVNLLISVKSLDFI